LEINITITELVYRVSAAARASMSELFSDTLIGYGWQVDEDAFLNDVKNYVGNLFDDGDILDKEVVEEVIYNGLNSLEEFMLDFYIVSYSADDEDFQGTLRECVVKFNLPTFKKEFKLEDLNPDWDDKYEDYEFNNDDFETEYREILELFFK